MRHRKKTVKLGRTTSHREAMLSGLVCDLIQEKRVTTTLSKAKAARPLAEKMVTLGKKGGLADRRRAISKLHQKKRVAILFDSLAPTFQDRPGGYTRIIKLGRRSSDSSEMAILEWVSNTPVEEKKPKKKAAPAEKPAAADAPKGKKAEAEKPAAEEKPKKRRTKKAEKKKEDE